MKKLTHWLAATMLIGLVLAFAARAADSPSVLLQKGIYAEETEGNLDSAIKIYEQIGADVAGNRAIAAQAQYRLAVCFEKQGKKEQAVAVLKELMRQFPTETALIAQSQQRLTALGQAPADVVTMRKMSLALSASVMAVSPNGRFCAVWWDYYDIKVTDISTNQSWILVKGTDREHVFGSLVFSPDSQRIAYDLGGKTIKVSTPDGSESKVVFVEKEGTKGELNVVGWLPDAGRLVVVRRFGSNSAIPSVLGEVDVRTGSLREIRNIPPGACFLSADGRYVAIREGMREGVGKISLVDLEAQSETMLVSGEVGEVVG